MAVSALLAGFTSRSDYEDKSFCDTCCINVNTDKKIRITEHPRVLLLVLKRYIVENIDGRLNIIKLTSKVNFDTIIIPDGRNYNSKSFVSHYGDTLMLDIIKLLLLLVESLWNILIKP